MTRDELEILISRGEGSTLEFKSSTKTLKAAFQTLCAFLNGEGGTVLIGVRDDGALLGQEVADKTLQQLAHYRAEIEPAAAITTERIVLDNGLDVLLLNADSCPTEGPFTFQLRAYERVENTTRGMPKTTYERLLKVRDPDRYRWESQPTDRFGVEDLDHDEVRRFVQAATATWRLPALPAESVEVVLDKLELRESGHLIQAAVVLFAPEETPHFLQLGIRMARFRGLQPLEFLDRKDVRGSAFHILAEAETFCERHLPLAAKVVSETFVRQERPLIPRDALREVLVNALIHRDYASAGQTVRLAVYDDRVEVSSPGRLPPGISVEDLTIPHESVLRNPRIADTFFRSGLVEKWGSGTLRVLQLCREHGVDPPVFHETGVSFVVTFHVPVGVTSVEFLPLTDGELRTARKRAGWSQKELAERIGVKDSTISHWERGTKSIPESRRDQLEELLAPHRSRRT
jgi:ATP-dependent DNA helicase RecG